MEDVTSVPPLSAVEIYEGSVFLVEHDSGTVELELTSVEMRTDTPDNYERFSLVFRGSVDEHLPQGWYRLEHPDLGAFDAVLVPVVGDETTPDSEWVHYEAVVNRPVSVPVADGPTRAPHGGVFSLGPVWSCSPLVSSGVWSGASRPGPSRG